MSKEKRVPGCKEFIKNDINLFPFAIETFRKRRACASAVARLIGHETGRVSWDDVFARELIMRPVAVPSVVKLSRDRGNNLSI